MIPEAEHVKIFRELTNWKEDFEKNNYGLIPLNNDLSALTIIVGKVDPSASFPMDFDFMKKYWSDLLDGQKEKKI